MHCNTKVQTLQYGKKLGGETQKWAFSIKQPKGLVAVLFGRSPSFDTFWKPYLILDLYLWRFWDSTPIVVWVQPVCFQDRKYSPKCDLDKSNWRKDKLENRTSTASLKLSHKLVSEAEVQPMMWNGTFKFLKCISIKVWSPTRWVLFVTGFESVELSVHVNVEWGQDCECWILPQPSHRQ